jgi:adenylate cyclase
MAKKIRLITGIILFSFLTCHLLNLSFGLVSLDALDDARDWFLWFWSTGPGIALLVGSMMSHLMFGLYALYNRNTLRMNMTDMVQLVLGLLIFPLLFGHLVGTVIGPMLTDERQSYFSILTLFWVLDPGLGLKQAVVTVGAWIHGCMGLVIWLRIQSWWPRVAGFIYPLVVAIPLFALLGMVEAGKEVIELNKDPEYAKAALNMLSPAEPVLDMLGVLLHTGLWTYFVILAAVLLARYYRVRNDRSRLSVTYANGSKLEVASGLTLLEISRMNNIPHASLCGGKGRCGTCRVRILEGMDILPEASEMERKILNRIKADPDTRLACQVIPQSGAIVIEQLFPPDIEPKDLRRARAVELASTDGDPIPRAAN